MFLTIDPQMLMAIKEEHAFFLNSIKDG